MPYITSVERFGRAQGLLDGIEVSLELKFGAEGLKLMPELRAIQDHEVLKAVLRAIKAAATPEDLRRIWAPKRRPRKRRRT